MRLDVTAGVRNGRGHGSARASRGEKRRGWPRGAETLRAGGITSSVRDGDEDGVTRCADRLQCAHELGSRNHVEAMKREHDTEPGPPDLTEETGPPSQSKPRQITARGLGAPAARSPRASKNESVDFTSNSEAQPPEDERPRFDNDSMDRALNAIGNRRRRVPVSLEEGRSQHVAPRALSSGNDTLPMAGKVVVDTLTDPGERQRYADDVPALSPQDEPKHDEPKRKAPRRLLPVALAAAGILLVGIALVALFRDGGGPTSMRPAPSSTASPPSPPTSTAPSTDPTAQATAARSAPPTSASVASSAPMSPPPPPAVPKPAPAKKPSAPKPATDTSSQDPPSSPWIKQAPL